MKKNSLFIGLLLVLSSCGNSTLDELQSQIKKVEVQIEKSKSRFDSLSIESEGLIDRLLIRNDASDSLDLIKNENELKTIESDLDSLYDQLNKLNIEYNKNK
jgi:hypothetical protein